MAGSVPAGGKTCDLRHLDVSRRALYVRAYNGQNSSWFQAAVGQKAGAMTAAGVTKELTLKEVTFDPVGR